MSATDADGFTHTVHLDCGCWMRLNYSDYGNYLRMVPKRGDWYSCREHSSIRDYDQRTGEPNLDRDRQVVRVVEEAAPPAQRVVALVSNHTFVDTTGKGKCDVCSFGKWLHDEPRPSPTARDDYPGLAANAPPGSEEQRALDEIDRLRIEAELAKWDEVERDERS